MKVTYDEYLAFGLFFYLIESLPVNTPVTKTVLIENVAFDGDLSTSEASDVISGMVDKGYFNISTACGITKDEVTITKLGDERYESELERLVSSSSLGLH